MKFSGKSLGLLLAAATGAVVSTTASVSPSITATAARFGLEKKSGLFGIQKRFSNGDSISVLNSIARGGSTAAAVEGEDEEEEEEVAPVLYLPGLLHSVVAKKKVGY